MSALVLAVLLASLDQTIVSTALPRTGRTGRAVLTPLDDRGLGWVRLGSRSSTTIR
jgi:hypothetical protein